MKLDQQIPISKTEPNLNFITSVIYHKHRMRFVGNRTFIRPVDETFHDFIEWFAINVLEITWIKDQSNRGHSLSRWVLLRNVPDTELKIGV